MLSAMHLGLARQLTLSTVTVAIVPLETFQQSGETWRSAIFRPGNGNFCKNCDWL
jgi:hypothetical protein